jgi:hypothetical protein
MLAGFILGFICGGVLGGLVMLWRLMLADHRKRVRDLRNMSMR